MKEFIISNNYKYIELNSDIEFYPILEGYLAKGYIISDAIYLAVELQKGPLFVLLSYLHIDNPDSNIKEKLRELDPHLAVELPDFSDTLLNIDGEIRENFGYQARFISRDRVIKKHYDRIALMILDGLGENVLFNNLAEDSFLRRHYHKTIHAIYPSTTAAATTSIISGLTPLESGWVGWENYFPELKRNIVLFNGMDFDTGEPLGVTGFDKLPYKPFYHDMDIKCEQIMPDFNIYPYDFNISLNKSIRLFKENKKMLQYIYCTNPDSIMHGSGAYSQKCKDFLAKLDKDIEAYSKRLPENTLIIISADHGHTNVDELHLYAFRSLNSMLRRRPCNEGRCLVFDVKDECKPQFEDLFNKVYGNIYRLYKTEEAIERGFFGINNKYIHERIDGFLGNYVALATSSYFFKFIPDRPGDKIIFKSHHAGITRNEMLIPIILIDSEDK